jgi:leader peptidase (prepilin peptidase)/N-methyltransferase
VTSGVIAMCAILGVLAGAGARPVVFALSVPTAHPPRTTCPGCHKAFLRREWRAVVAVLSDRCRSCRARIAAWPAVVEVVLGVVFALVAHQQTEIWVVLASCWLAAHGAAAALIDAAVRRVPNVLALSAYAGVVAMLAVAGVVEHRPTTLLPAVLAGIALAGFYGVIALASRGGWEWTMSNSPPASVPPSAGSV